MRLAVAIGVLLLVGVLRAEPGRAEPCDQSDDYARALCLYHEGRLETASELFAAIVERDEKRPATIRSAYFLARIRMRQKRWEDASRLLIGIFSRSPSFYWEWNGDYLLGVCREELGRS